jgi:hypothetical protein
VKGGVGYERFLRSQRGMARRRWWPESAGPRAQAGELVGGECSGLTITSKNVIISDHFLVTLVTSVTD